MRTPTSEPILPVVAMPQGTSNGLPTAQEPVLPPRRAVEVIDHNPTWVRMGTMRPGYTA